MTTLKHSTVRSGIVLAAVMLLAGLDVQAQSSSSTYSNPYSRTDTWELRNRHRRDNSYFVYDGKGNGWTVYENRDNVRITPHMGNRTITPWGQQPQPGAYGQFGESVPPPWMIYGY